MRDVCQEGFGKRPDPSLTPNVMNRILPKNYDVDYVIDIFRIVEGRQVKAPMSELHLYMDAGARPWFSVTRRYLCSSEYKNTGSTLHKETLSIHNKLSFAMDKVDALIRNSCFTSK
jgi:hypothetical protein